jgi:ATP-dependent RNA/DNA helicase IGHMBP2
VPDNDHLLALSAAIDGELEWEAAEHARLCNMPLADRIAAGLTWPSMQLAGVTRQWRGARLSLAAAGRAPLHDGITPGDLLTIAPIATPDKGLQARCVDVEGSIAEVRIEDLPDPLPGWLEGGHLAVSRALDDSSMRRYQQAVEAAQYLDSPLKTALLTGQTNTPPDEMIASDALNVSQRRAVSAILAAEPLGIVHGPPGTGKTRVLVAALAELIDAGRRPWALAASNAAVDHIAAQADAAGISVLRLGRAYRVGPAAAHLTLSARMDASSQAPALRRLEAEMSKADWRVRRTLAAERRDLVAGIRRQIFEECDVIASTLGTMVNEARRLPKADIALIDEATQAIEPAVWSIVPHIESLILIGDPHQLGPVVHEPNNILETSLVERLLAQGTPAPMLEQGYRMSASLTNLVAGIYGPRYRPAPSVAARRLSDLPGVDTTPLTAAPVIFVDTSGSGMEEARDGATMSLYNDGEVDLIAMVVQMLFRAGLPREDIGVIAPYSAQVARLREALPDVEVATVNAFQGREKQAILCSFVRSNQDGTIGFVADRRRLVVSVTRAKRLLVCVGDAGTLSTSSDLADLCERIQAAGGWQSVWEEPWDAAMA